MLKRLSYIFVCTIVLAGCSKFIENNEKQVNTNQVQNDNSVQNENQVQSDKESSESNTDIANNETDQAVEDATRLEQSNNTISTDEQSQDKTNTTDESSGIISSVEEKNQSINIVKKYNLPEGFVYVDDVILTVELEIRYYTAYNFVGEKIDGYESPLAILTTQAADALKVAADHLAEEGYRIKIYDAYRPQKAVNHFVRWSQTEDASMKEIFYPSMEKSVLFTDGYISKKSRHSRGSTVDLTIVDQDDNEIDMGGYFDLLDTISNYDTTAITEEQHANREYLRDIMDEAGFDSIRTEWWHFQLRDEPYPDTYFDFDIE
ncbi:MAG: M15 family metallopeptidase [Lachnotalea sp.]